MPRTIVASFGLGHKAAIGVGLSAVAFGCGSEPALDVPVPATLVWSQPADATTLYRPVDMKASRRDRVWVVDAATRVVLRLSPPAGEYLMFGFRDAEPREVEDPYRLAVSEELGVFVYDRGTEAVDLYTAGGQHVRGFRPGFQPLAMYLTRQPYGLLFAVADSAPEAQPYLLLIWTDVDGGNRDTLIGPAAGPQPLRNLEPKTGETFVAPSRRGAWVWSKATPDTAFEVARRGAVRRLLLRAAERPLQGLFVDGEEGILWLARPADAGGIRYEACDLSGSDDLDSARCLLGVRTTPADFAPQEVVRGAAVGWLRKEKPTEPFRTAAYDLRSGELRTRSNTVTAARPR